MSDNGLVWESPPGRATRYRNWVTCLEELNRRPGEWALVHEQSEHQTENQARMAANSIKLVAKRLGVGVEAISRMVDGGIKVYARVVAS